MDEKEERIKKILLIRGYVLNEYKLDKLLYSFRCPGRKILVLCKDNINKRIKNIFHELFNVISDEEKTKLSVLCNVIFSNWDSQIEFAHYEPISLMSRKDWVIFLDEREI